MQPGFEAVIRVGRHVKFFVFAGFLPIQLIMEIVEQQTKRCRFCAEIIQAEAIKCRFCNEFLTPPRQSRGGDDKDQEESEGVFFKGRPSMWALAGFFVRTIVLLATALTLVFYPVENLLGQYAGPDISESQILTAAYYIRLTGKALAVLFILLMLLKIVRLKSTRYEVTSDRIEWARGIFSRKIDNIDMFRVIDLRLHRSLLDCILGIGTVTLITKDQTDPEFSFEKIRKPRGLYDLLKKASLDADRKQNVIHIE